MLKQSGFAGRRQGLLRPQRAVALRRPYPARCEARSGRTDTGKRFEPEALAVGAVLGEGSYGQVFKGTLATPTGSVYVVLKRVKGKVEVRLHVLPPVFACPARTPAARTDPPALLHNPPVQGAQEMVEMEHLLNVYAAKAARGAVAHFLGYSDVASSRGRLSRGLWLVWAYQGDRSLAYYLRRRDCLEALAADMGLPGEGAVPPTVLRQVFECLLGLHAAGLVHRDVKPANLVLCEADRRFRCARRRGLAGRGGCGS